MPRMPHVSRLVVLITLFVPAAFVQAQQSVTSFTLMNADSNLPIAAFDPLLDGALLDLNTLPTRNLNIVAHTSPPVVGSVRFGLNANPNFRTESVAPYALAGDNDGNYLPWTPFTGEQTLIATPYTQANAGGSAGTPLMITFTVVDGDQPTPTPRPDATPPPSAGAWTYIERDGWIGFEVESAPPSADWRAETTAAGYTGDGYYTWRGPNLFGTPGVGVLTYRLRVTNPGVYQMRIRNHHSHPDPTEENDCWVRMNGGDWIKVFSHQVNHWNFQTNFDFHAAGQPPASYNLTAGDHVFEISGRSMNFRIDRVIFYLSDVSSPWNPDLPQSPTVEGAAHTGDPMIWHRQTLTFEGPVTDEEALPNPFRDYRMTVRFMNQGRWFDVPGFYAADGDAAESGASGGGAWRAHFTPDAEGVWSWWARFRHGADVAVDDDPFGGEAVSFHGRSGTFSIGATDKTAPDHRYHGTLRYVDGHHLQFAGSGAYYLKGGADSPENLLGYEDFDGTYDTGGLIPGFLHTYAPHVPDWQPGDPTWHTDKGKGLIGGLNYLSDRGVNSVYFLTYNIDGGDGADTWPWVDHTSRDRFDCSKLDQWEIVFSHMDAKGIQLHVVTQETENDLVFDNGQLGVLRKLYYRELVARFAHHHALIWNLGEENNNSDLQRRAFAAYIRNLDPYDHPITVHTYYNQADTYYIGLLGAPWIEATSIQGDAIRYNQWAISLRQLSTSAGRPWAIYGDEQGPPVDKDMGNLDILRKHALWGNLMGGGAGVEWYFGYQGDFGDVQSEDWRVAEPLWDLTRHALEFFHEYLPFWEMTPNNSLASNASTPRVLAKPGDVYVVHLPIGGAPNLDLAQGLYRVQWFDPRHGGPLRGGTVHIVTGPGTVSLGQPPDSPDSDWVVLVSTYSGSAASLSLE